MMTNKYYSFLGFLGVFILAIFSWNQFILFFSLPTYILPKPSLVISSFIQHASLIFLHFKVTCLEMILGMLVAVGVGLCSARMIMFSEKTKRFFLSFVLMSQAIPVFAITPLIILWFGYGMCSKFLIVALMLFFPVASALIDGLCRTPRVFIEQAKIMGASERKIFWYVQLPYALPNFASGVRMAAAYAPLAAVMGEWVGSNRGLGFLILMANAQVQIDFLFAVLLVLIGLSLGFYFLIDKILRKIIVWKN